LITGLSHITFVVSDLERSTLFFEKIFGAKEVYSSGDKTFSISKEKFFIINNLWICIMEGEPLSERTYNHIAFQIQESEFDSYFELIKDTGVEIKPERPRLNGEGRSIYFYDFDNYLFELHTGTLDKRLQLYSKQRGKP
jgi:catechol 2,3-dioxygenase-like lactoylglutathione lyase family enzyme